MQFCVTLGYSVSFLLTFRNWIYPFTGSWKWQLHILRVMRWFMWTMDARCYWGRHWKCWQEVRKDCFKATNHYSWKMDWPPSMGQVRQKNNWYGWGRLKLERASWYVQRYSGKPFRQIFKTLKEKEHYSCSDSHKETATSFLGIYHKVSGSSSSYITLFCCFCCLFFQV